MNLPTLFIAIVLLCAAQTSRAEESFYGTVHRPGFTHPSHYSFADLYSLALSGSAGGLPLTTSSDAPIRTAAVQQAAQFSVSEAREPQLGVLLLSGLALAAWVARRRLGYAV